MKINIIKYNIHYYTRIILWIIIIILLLLSTFFQIENNKLLIILLILFSISLFIYNVFIKKYNNIGELFFENDSIKIICKKKEEILPIKNLLINCVLGNLKGDIAPTVAIFRGSNIFDGTNNKIEIKTNNRKIKLRFLLKNQKERDFLLTYFDKISRKENVIIKLKKIWFH